MATPEQTTAILVGIERYDAGSTWNLNGPLNDVLAMLGFLRSCGVPQNRISAYVSPLAENEPALATIRASCNAVEVPTEAALNDLIERQLPEEDCELLFVYWSGHGFMTTKQERLLFTADAQTDLKRNVDVASMLQRLGSDVCPRVRRVDLVVDACANYMVTGTEGVSRRQFAAGAGMPEQQQFAFFAASPGEYARNVAAGKTGLFSRELMRLLLAETAPPKWPPNWSSVSRVLATRFEDLRREDPTIATPSTMVLNTPTETIRKDFRTDDSADKFFRRLGTFAGGFSFRAAAMVNHDLRPRDVDLQLKRLLDAGLIVEERGERPRYRLTDEAARAAAARLEVCGEKADARDRHADFVRTFVEVHERRLMAPDRRASMHEIEAELPNILSAIDWCTTRPALHERALRLAAGLFWFWNFSAAFSRGRALTEQVRNACDDNRYTAERARVLYAAGGLAFLEGSYDLAKELLSESVDIWRSLSADDVERNRWLAYALVILGRVEHDLSKAQQCETEAEHLFVDTKDPWGHALALNDKGYVLMLQERFDEARTAYLQSLSLWDTLRDPWGRPLTLNNLGNLMAQQGDLKGARSAHDDALRDHLSEGDKWGAAESLKYLAEVALKDEDYAEADACYRESLRLHRAVNRRELVADCLLRLAELTVCNATPLNETRAESAAELLAVWGTERTKYNFVCTPDEIALADRLATRLRARLGPARYATVHEAGKGLSVDAVIERVPPVLV
ncbi:MAG TPA: tetratricopeptide repeat protein [Candidatus Baltobacteraceae bacterium]|nr:tetratricopeptide repeat protein [Candidatus Baltobacteraceae bacterium]